MVVFVQNTTIELRSAALRRVRRARRLGATPRRWLVQLSSRDVAAPTTSRRTL